MSDIISKSSNYIMNTYGRFPIVLDHGEGCYVYDDKGKKYLDFVGGIAVNCLGHGDKELTDTISEQAKKLIHCSNLYWTKPQVELAEKLVKNSCFSKVFFCNSGAESIEGALKLTRKYGNTKSKKRSEIITMINSFHGRTYGAVTATGQEKYHKDFEPLLPGIKYAEFNNFELLENTVTDETIGIVLEPIQGEGGILPAEKEYLEKVRKLCDEKDILLIYDEIQCGIGRTGHLFAYEYYGVEPDIAVVAKGIAGGVPCGILLAKENVADVFKPGDHASTFGGNPLATSAGNVVIDRLLNGLLENVNKQSQYLKSKLGVLKDKYSDKIKSLRGVGLMQGIELSIPREDIINASIESGLLLVGAGKNVIRFVPPLIVSENEIDEMIKILDKVFSEV